jgi:branched-chain amino acid transport system substrate-binding protein
MNTILVSGDALVNAEYWTITGDAGEGTLMTFSPDPRKEPANEALNKTFRDKKVEPEGYVYYAYAALQVWVAAVTKAGSTDFDPVLAALNSETFKTVLGDLKFNDKGDVDLPGYVFYEWKAGKYDYVN